MDLDESVKVANAYNYNAFPHAATDPSRILLVHSYPYYGWMVSRKHAEKMTNLWIPSQEVSTLTKYMKT